MSEEETVAKEIRRIVELAYKEKKIDSDFYNRHIKLLRNNPKIEVLSLNMLKKYFKTLKKGEEATNNTYGRFLMEEKPNELIDFTFQKYLDDKIIDKDCFNTLILRMKESSNNKAALSIMHYYIDILDYLVEGDFIRLKPISYNDIKMVHKLRVKITAKNGRNSFDNEDIKKAIDEFYNNVRVYN